MKYLTPQTGVAKVTPETTNNAPEGKTMDLKCLGDPATTRHIYKVAAVKDGRREYLRVYSRNKVNARRLVIKNGYDEVVDVELLA